MSKFQEDFYDEDKNYQVIMFLDSMRVPFKASRKEIEAIFRYHRRPKWLRPRNFGVTSGDASLMIKIDLSKVIVIEAKEITGSGIIEAEEINSTDGPEQPES